MGGFTCLYNIHHTYVSALISVFVYSLSSTYLARYCDNSRAGPNYQRGLKMMRECSNSLGLNFHIYGPDVEMTAVIPLALGIENISNYNEFDGGKDIGNQDKKKAPSPKKPTTISADTVKHEDPTITVVPTFEGKQQQQFESSIVENFTPRTRCVVYGSLQHRAVQSMLDFDYTSKRDKPSVAAMIYPFKSNHYVKFFWGTEEILLPVYQTMDEAFEKHPDVTVVVNFASFRSVYDSVLEILDNYSNQITTIAVIAEGVPESQTRALIKVASKKKVGLIGPATVGGIKPGCFRIGNSGTLEMHTSAFVLEFDTNCLPSICSKLLNYRWDA